MSSPIFFSPNSSYQKIFFTPEESKNLSKLRIIQKNLVHFQNFPDFLLNKDILSSKEYFGKFGKILKIVIVSKEDEITKKKQNSAYITFSNNKEAALAILNFDSILIGENLVRAFFGTSKYCIHFLNNLECFNKEKCMFVHQLANENDYLGVNSKFRYSEHIKLAKKIVKDNNFNNNDKSNINVNDQIIIPKRKTSNSSQNSNLSKNTLDTSAGSGIINNKCYDNLSLFKSKNQSRFFNNKIDININNKINNNEIDNSINNKNNNNDINNINNINIINIDISDNLKIIINNILMRYGFFKRFDNFFKLDDLENYLCKNIYKGTNDDNIKFVFENIN